MSGVGEELRGIKKRSDRFVFCWLRSSPSASRLTPFAPQGAEPRSGEGSGGALRETTRSETRSGEAGVREGET